MLVPLGEQVGRLTQRAMLWGQGGAPDSVPAEACPSCFPGPLCSPGQTVSECHQEEEAGGLCPAPIRRPESQLLSNSAGRLWSSGRQGQLPFCALVTRRPPLLVAQRRLAELCSCRWSGACRAPAWSPQRRGAVQGSVPESHLGPSFGRGTLGVQLLVLKLLSKHKSCQFEHFESAGEERVRRQGGRWSVPWQPIPT